jgi:hypothetical protein
MPGDALFGPNASPRTNSPFAELVAGSGSAQGGPTYKDWDASLQTYPDVPGIFSRNSVLWIAVPLIAIAAFFLIVYFLL